MAEVKGGLELLRALCDALGIDWRNRPVTTLTVTVGVKSVPVVEVRELARSERDGFAHFEEVLSRYTLAPADADAPHVVTGASQ
jgi:predicted secreted protein